MLSIDVLAKSLTIYNCEFYSLFIYRNFRTTFLTNVYVHLYMLCMHFNKTVLRVYIHNFKWIVIEFPTNLYWPAVLKNVLISVI